MHPAAPIDKEASWGEPQLASFLDTAMVIRAKKGFVAKSAGLATGRYATKAGIRTMIEKAL